MTLQVISVEEIRKLLAKLMEKGRVVAPHARPGDRQYVFDDLKDPEDAILTYTSTVLPPKKYAFPPKETLTRYELGEEPKIEPVVEAEPITLFGVHDCDLHGMLAMDLAFEEKYPDANYLEKRAKMRIIGVQCEPDEHCFCASMGAASADEGYDLYLTRLVDEQEYLVEVATDAGEEMLEGIQTREATAAEAAQIKIQIARRVEQERSINADVAELPLLFTNFDTSPVWQKWADKCYSCGTCNMVCSTCVCFDVLDQMGLSLGEGERVREWDGCMLEPFAEVAGGENFREERKDRLRHRFFRKYAYLYTRHGKPFCCGCGRCVRQCLADIDPVAVINELIEAHTKEATSSG